MAIRMDPLGRETAALRELVPSFAGLRVLEIGCGDGRLTRRYAGEAGSVVASDPNAIALERFRLTMPEPLRGHVELRRGGIDELSIGAATFDLVLFAWSL